MRYELVDGQGNFGSIDDDPPAAMRYCVVGDTRVVDARGQRADRRPRRGPRARQRPRRRPARARPPRAAGPRVEGLSLRRSPDAARCARARATRSPARTTTRVLCLVDMLGVPLFMWKFLDELAPGDRVLISRTPREDVGGAGRDERALAELLGAFVSEGFASESRAGFNNVDHEFFDRVLAAYDRHVGGRRYVYERTIRSGSRLRELDIHDLTSAARVAAGVPDRAREPRQARARARLAGLAGVQARVPAGAVHGRRLVVAAAAQHDPGLLLVLQRAARKRGADAAARVRRHQPALRPDGARRAQGRHHEPPRRAAVRASASGSSASSRTSSPRPRDDPAREPRAEPRPRAVPRDVHPRGGRRPRRDREWLRKHNVDRVERWEREGIAIMERIAVRRDATGRRAARHRRLLLRLRRVRRGRGRRAGLLAARRHERPLVPHRRLRQPQHRSAAAARRDGDAARPRRRHRRLRPELRRAQAGADGAAGALPEPARQRLVGDRRRDGDEHPAAQPVARSSRRSSPTSRTRRSRAPSPRSPRPRS